MATITTPAPQPGPGEHPDRTDADAPARPVRPFLVAAAASIGAGAIHAGAVGVHSEHKQAAYAFAGLAFFQLAWGAVAVGSARRRSTALAGAVVSGVAIGGWVLAKTSGIGFIDGLGDVEGIQWPDFLAAFLALVAFVPAVRVLLVGDGRSAAVAAAPSVPDLRPVRSSTRFAAVGIVGALSLVGMSTVSGHTHAGHTHDTTDAAAGHTHSATADGSGHVHADAILPTKVYDPKLPIDLSGVPGVTPQEQARAENLIAITLIRLPHFADYKTAEAEGYHSIGDAFTGFEHFVNWKSIDDDVILDPDHPESLVYSTAGGKRTLVSAMFMLAPPATLEDVPDIGGSLTQWHIHDNLCYGGPEDAPTVAGTTNADGTCPSGLRQFTPVPMIHVWITKNACGPFAALEGVGAGQIADGQTRLCDHVHGGA